MSVLDDFAARNGFLPHGYCFQWDPTLLWSLVFSDTAIALAYFSIPLVIVRFVRRRPQVNLGGLGWLFGIFIFACGVTHFLDVWTIWRPDYVLQAGAKAFTALASLGTAVIAWRLLPQALALPSTAELSAALNARQLEMQRRRDVESNLQEIEQSLATTLATVDAGFITTDELGRVTRMNAVAERITGWSALEAAGQSLWQVFNRVGRPDSMLERNPVDVVGEMSPHGSYRMTTTCIARDGRHTRVDVNAALTLHPDASVRGMTVVFRDMERLSHAEAEVRRLASVVESSADAIIVKRLDGSITDWNPAAERMFGYSAAEAIGRPSMMLVPDERVSEEIRIDEDLAQGRSIPPLRTWRLAKDGRRIEVSLQVSPLRDEAGRVIGGAKSARDLTHQRQIESALRQSQARLNFALEAAAIGNWELDLAGGDILRSRRCDQCFGLENPAARWTRADLIACVHPDDRRATVASLQATERSGRPWHAEFRIVWPDGSLHWLRMDGRVSAGGEIDNTGDVGDRLIGTVVDVTEARSAEQMRRQAEALEEENRRTQEASRMKSLFLANMSHELRTPLNGVIGFADLLRTGVVPHDSPKHDEYLGLISQCGHHLLQMINDVLDLSKIEAGKLDFTPTVVDLPGFVQEVAGTFRLQLQERGLELHVTIAPDLHTLVMDDVRLKQVLFNYLSNAIKFTPAGGRIQIRAFGLGERYWRLEVEDTGIGIEPEHLSRLFAEFSQVDSSLAKPHEGAGLGLALTRRLVEAQGGRVGVRSTAGAGSCFFAVLPRRYLAVVSGAASPRLLLALQPAATRDLLVNELATQGLLADDASSAAEIVQLGRVRQYSALAIDLYAQESSALGALAELRTGGPSSLAPVRVVGADGGQHGLVAFAITELLAKPLEPEALARTLARLQLAHGEAVLVVEDDPKARELMATALGAAGLRAVCVDDGIQALERLPQVRPGAMVLDLMLPDLDGFQVLDRLRRMPEWAELPVVVWTALALSAQERERLNVSARAIATQHPHNAAGVIRDTLMRCAREEAESGADAS